MSDGEVPALRMLWEDTDPQTALSERLGLADARAAASWVAATVRGNYGIADARCERIVLSANNALAWVDSSAGALLLKWTSDRGRFDRLRAVAAMTGWLADRGSPVSAPVPGVDGALQVQADGASMSLQRQVPGSLLDVRDPGLVRAAGATLAELHRALAAYPCPMPDAAVGTMPWVAQVHEWLADPPAHLPSAALDALRDRLASVVDDEADASVRHQPVHGDFRAANVLTGAGRITAVIDFEETRVDQPVGELARSAVLLGTLFRGWGPIPVSVREQFLRGYGSVAPLTDAETRMLDLLVLWLSLRFVPVGGDPRGWGSAVRAQLP